MAHILLAGGSGFIGKKLTALLSSRGHSVSVLSRKKGEKNTFSWNPAKGEMDASALSGVDAVVNLAGASLADGRWTKTNKRRIIDSRVDSGRLLFETIRKNTIRPSVYVTASAIGYYGNSGDHWVTETAHPGHDFLADTCIQWEKEAWQLESLGIRTVAIRTGLVLDHDEGILPVLSSPIRWGLGATLGGGRQYMSWIHIKDLCGIYTTAIEDPRLRGPFNAVAPNPVRQKEFFETLARFLHRPFWLPNVPAWVMRLVLGEKADLVLQGQRVSADKITEAGYSFQHTQLDAALKAIFLRAQ